MAYEPTLRPDSTGLFCTDLPLCDTDTEGHVNHCVTFATEYLKTVRDTDLVPKDHH